MMINSRILKFLTLLVLLLSSTTACADKSTADKSSGHAASVSSVQIYPGFELGNLLADPQSIRSQAEVGQLLARPWYATVEVRAAGGKAQQPIDNCKQYLSAHDQHLQPVKEFERAAYQEFGLMCLAARDIIQAEPATENYLQDFKLDQSAPQQLPKQLALMIAENEQQRMMNNDKLQFWSQVEAAKLTSSNDHHAVYTTDGAEQTLSLLASGDFNSDGINDLLLTSRDRVSGGSYSGMRMWLITRSGDQAKIRIIKTYQAL